MICSDNFDNHMGEGRQLIATNVVNKGVDIFTFCTFFFFVYNTQQSFQTWITEDFLLSVKALKVLIDLIRLMLNPSLLCKWKIYSTFQILWGFFLVLCVCYFICLNIFAPFLHDLCHVNKIWKSSCKFCCYPGLIRLSDIY